MRLHSFLCAAAVLAATSSPVLAAPISALYVFGDSLSDTGNFSAAVAQAIPGPGPTVPAPPYAAGRASNGMLAVEYLAAALGLPVNPAALGGTNYAFIGAATGNVPNPAAPGTFVDNVSQTLTPPLDFGPTGMATAQLPLFSVRPGALPIDPSALFFIWGGANDLFISPTDDTATAAAENIQDMVWALYAGGARRFFIPNLPGIVPNATTFNTALADTLVNPGLLPGIEIIQFDTFGFCNGIAQNPAAFGFTNLSDPCFVPTPAFPGAPVLPLGLSPGTTCTTPDQYLLWDAVHPTAAAHRQLGLAFAQAAAPVPEPVTLALVGLGLAALARRRRRIA